MSKTQGDYPVGYKKPPVASQFRKGRSGNPTGRPKGSKGLAGMFMSIISERIVVIENGRTKTISRIEGILRQFMNKALSGDRKVLLDCIDFFRDFEEIERLSPGKEQPMQREKIVFESILKRINSSGTKNETASSEEK